MSGPDQNRTFAVLLLRTIAGALIIYGAVQIVISVIGRAQGVAEAAPFTTHGVLHGLAGIAVWLLARPAARFIARGLE
jgi:hypothetical protein